MVKPKSKASHERSASWQYAWKNDGSRATAWFSRSIACSQSALASPLKGAVGSNSSTCVKIESDKVGGWLTLDGQFLGSRDLGVQPLGDFLRNLALDRKQVVQIALVLFGPDVRVRARVDQLRIHMKPGTAPANASLQHMRYSQLVADLTHIPLAAIVHHAGPADHLQIGDFRQLGQNVVLHAIDESRVFLSARLNFQMAERRFQLLPVAG